MIANPFARKLVFTHYWITGFGWEPTAYVPSDFPFIERLGRNSEDGLIFLAKNSRGVSHIFKGHYESYL
jgi:hypothetical protein